MEIVIASVAGLAVFGFVGYKLYQSRNSKPTTSEGGRTQSSNPSRYVETKTENKVEANSSSQPPKRKSNTTRSAKPRKSTPRKSTAKKTAPKKSTAKTTNRKPKNVKSKG